MQKSRQRLNQVNINFCLGFFSVLKTDRNAQLNVHIGLSHLRGQPFSICYVSLHCFIVWSRLSVWTAEAYQPISSSAFGVLQTVMNDCPCNYCTVFTFNCITVCGHLANMQEAIVTSVFKKWAGKTIRGNFPTVIFNSALILSQIQKDSEMANTRICRLVRMKVW